MSYEELRVLIQGKELPITAGNEHNEAVFIQEGVEAAGSHYIETVTFQTNGWLRTNTYYADGTTTESYSK